MKRKFLSFFLAASIILSTGVASAGGSGQSAETAIDASTKNAVIYKTNYEAEASSVTKVSASVKSEINDFSGSGYVEGFVDGSSLTFTVNVPADGNYGIRLFYLNGSGANKTVSLYVGGEKVKTSTLLPTINWYTWAEQLETVTLKSGDNTISYRNDALAAADGIKIDRITVSQIYELENSTYSGTKVKVATDKAGYSGTGFAAGFEDNGDTVSTVVNAPEAGEYVLTTRYSNGTGNSSSRWIYLYVGENRTKLGMADLRSWDLWYDYKTTVTLKKGANTISYKREDGVSGGLNLDYFTVSPSNWNYAGAVTKVEGNNTKELTFTLDNSTVKISSSDSNAVKVWLEPSNRFSRKYESFAISNQDVAPEKLKYTDKTTYYEVDAGDMLLHVQKSPFKITYLDKSGNVLMENESNSMGWTEEGEIAVNNKIKTDEAFWGLGEVEGEYNRRGQRKVMWSSDIVGGDMESAVPDWENGRSDMAHPYYISSSGYSVLFDNPGYTVFDMGKTSVNTASFGSYNPHPAGELCYYFIYGGNDKSDTVKQVTKTLTDLSGKSFFAPDWALGNMQSYWGYNQESIVSVAQSYRDNEIPLDVMMADIDWYEYYCTPTQWNKTNFSDPERMLARLDALNLRMGVIDDPNITDRDKDGANVDYNIADTAGYFVKAQNNLTKKVNWPWGGASGLMDFFNPAARTWWKSQHDMILNQGIQCFWLDMNEPSAYNTDWLFWNEQGKSYGNIGDVKNAYANMHNQTIFEMMTEDGDRPFFLTRGGTIGSQKYTSPWTGDILSGWVDMHEQISFGTGLSLSGYNYWGFDIGGFSGDPTNDQYKRWVELAAFTPVHRFHSIAGYDKKQAYTHDATEVSRKYIGLRYNLMPYMYSVMADGIVGTGNEEGYSDIGTGTGIPYTRPMVMEYPNDKNTWNIDTQFMAGSSFLVAPVVEDSTSKDVYLPSGDWYDYADSETVYSGGRTINYNAPVDVLPTFVKAGSIIPMQPDMQYVGEKPIDIMTLDVYPTRQNGDFHFVLYEDDGETNDYADNKEYATTRFDCNVAKSGTQQTLTLDIGKRIGSYANDERESYMIQLHNAGYRNVTAKTGNTSLTKYASLDLLQKAVSGYYSDEVTGICYVKVADNFLSNKITVTGDTSDEIVTEAENATRSGAANVKTTVTGFSGTGYVTGLDSAADSVTFANVSAAADGEYAFYIRYQSASDATVSVKANSGPASDLALYASGTWVEKVVIVSLNKGNNTVSIAGKTGSSAVLIDKIGLHVKTVILPAVTAESTQAEKGALTGAAKSSSSTIGYTGSGYVENFAATGDGVKLENIWVAQDGTYALSVRYFNNNTENGTLSFYVGDNTAGAVKAAFKKFNQNFWDEIYVNVRLKAGDNTVTIARLAGDTGGVLIDRVSCPLNPITITKSAADLLNNGFELGNMNNWTYWSEGNSGHGVDKNDALLGSYKFYFYASNSKQRISQTVNLENGTYILNFYAKSYCFASGMPPCQVELKNYDGTDEIISEILIGSYGGQYNRYEVPVEVKDGKLYVAFSMINTALSGDTSLQLDDITLLKVDKPVVSVNKSLLESAVQDGRTLSYEDYTSDTWRKYIKALAMAEKVLSDSSADMASVIGAIQYLKQAVGSLVNEDRSDEEAAKAVDALITALPAKDKLKPSDKAAVAEARDAYEELSDIQKNLVTKLSVLEEAEAIVNPTYAKGDVNGDKELDIADMLMVRNVLIGSVTDPGTIARAYVNDDNQLDIADMMAVRNILINR